MVCGICFNVDQFRKYGCFAFWNPSLCHSAELFGSISGKPHHKEAIKLIKLLVFFWMSTINNSSGIYKIVLPVLFTVLIIIRLLFTPSIRSNFFKIWHKLIIPFRRLEVITAPGSDFWFCILLYFYNSILSHLKISQRSAAFTIPLTIPDNLKFPNKIEPTAERHLQCHSLVLKICNCPNTIELLDPIYRDCVLGKLAHTHKPE